jgi:hypothetical protein
VIAHRNASARAGPGERGQATVEWLALVLLVAALALGLLALGMRLPGLAMAEEIGAKLVCLAGLDGEQCVGGQAGSPLLAAYGAEVAAELAGHAPRIEYEPGMRAVPVDFRSCRRDPCSLGPPTGQVTHAADGEPVTLFVHALDCRGGAEAVVPRLRYDCSGERAGHLYLQYWAYYPGSQSLRGLPGNPGFHQDDWESFQVKLGGGEALARASSHHGYNYTAGAGSWLSDAGITQRPAWGPSSGRYFISGGSHAGHVEDDPDAAERFTPGPAIRLVPLEPLAAGGSPWRFAITPPWRKRVYRDPEHEGTD